MNDVERGRQALQYFHDASKSHRDYVPKSLSELLALYGTKAEIYLDGVGTVIRFNEMSDRQVKAAMENLALKSAGRIPKDHQGYMNALGAVAGEISYLDLTKQVVKDVIVEGAEGLAFFGDSVKTILKVATIALPFVVGYLAYKYVTAKGKSFK